MNLNLSYLSNRIKTELKNRKNKVIAILVFALSLPALSQATIINYTASPLGGGQWQYAYMIENNSLMDPLNEFTIYFQSNLYENLAVISSPVNWDSLVIQPDTGLPSDGFFDAMSLSAGLLPGGVDGLFSISFNYLGTGTPSEQMFGVYDVNFNLIDSGITSPIPEPNTLLMLVIGLFLLFCYKNKRSICHYKLPLNSWQFKYRG